MNFFIQIRCCHCDVEFCMTETLHASRKSDGKDFFCPNGHAQVFRKTTEDFLKEKLAQTERLLQSTRELRDQNWERAQKAERALQRAKAQAKRVQRTIQEHSALREKGGTA